MTRYILFTLLLLATCSGTVIAQEGSSSVPAADRLRDPASNRLFWMSTGRLMEPGRLSLGTFELLALQGGYAPNDFVQFNVSAVLWPDDELVRYASGGTKLQLIAPSGYFHGLAAGADLGFVRDGGPGHWNLMQTYNVAASVGTDVVELHGAFTLSSRKASERVRFTPLVQAGISIDVAEDGEHGTKLIGELWMVKETDSPLKPSVAVVGVRSYGPRFVWELAFVAGPPFSFHGGSSDPALTIYPLPYLSATWYF